MNQPGLGNHCIVIVFLLSVMLLLPSSGHSTEPVSDNPAGIRLENRHFAVEIKSDSTVTAFFDKRNGENYINPNREQCFCLVTMAKGHGPLKSSAISQEGNLLNVSFTNGAVVTLRYRSTDSYISLAVESFIGPDGAGEASNLPFYKLEFGRAFLKMDYTRPEAFGVSALIQSIQTNVYEYPGQVVNIGGICYAELGYKDAQIALVGVPEKKMRSVMKQVTEEILALAAQDESYRKIMPAVSRAGGGFAMDIPKNYGSYIIVSKPIKAEEVPQWTEHLSRFGVNQIDFHQGVVYRQGDFQVSPAAYPNGISDFRKMTDELKQRGFTAGLHTYAEFIAWGTKYLTPAQSKDLKYLNELTLAESMTEASTEIKVNESTSGINTTTGFFVLNSLYLQIDDEIIRFREVGPNGFPQCDRGMMGTKVTVHEKGASVRHFAQMFGYFAPRPESALFLEIARNTAKMYDQGGFGMIYLDALDGTGAIIDNRDFIWYYDALFVREILNNITTQPPLLEYSTMHPSLWAARSRMGAWDSPAKGYIQFFDEHFNSNRYCASSRYLPGQMGWFAVCPGGDYADNFAVQTLYNEHLEYLGTKILAHNYGLSYLDISLGQLSPAAYGNGQILKTFDLLRRENVISDSVKEQLKTPGKHFHLVQDDNRCWFVPAEYEYIITNERRQTVTVENPFADQRPFIRIENLHSPIDYDSPENIDLAVFDENASVKENAQTRTFDQPLDLTKHLGMGMWVLGNGGNQLLNIRVESPAHLTSGYTDHIVKLDFTGWKYLTFAECNNGDYPAVSWPLGRNGLYHKYREKVHYNQVDKVHIMINGDASGLRFRTLKAIPLSGTKLLDPILEINGSKVQFEGEIAAGHYAQFTDGQAEVIVRNPSGSEIGRMKVVGRIPEISSGQGQVTFENSSPRTRWTIGFFGDEIR